MKPLAMITVALCALYAVSGLLRKPKSDAAVDPGSVAALPVLLNGRLKPLDTVARNALLIIHGKQTLKWEDAEGEKRRLPAMDWLMEVLFDAPAADARNVFTIHNAEVLALIEKRESDGKHFPYRDLAPFLSEIDRQAEQAKKEDAQLRSPFQKQVIKLQRQAWLYGRLQHALQTPRATDVEKTLDEFLSIVEPGLAASAAQERGEEHDAELLARMTAMATSHFEQSERAHFFPVPPVTRGEGPDGWRRFGQSVMQSAEDGTLPEATRTWAAIGDAFRTGDSKALASAAAAYGEWLERNEPDTRRTARHETRFNQMQPFYRAIVLYVIVFIAACWFWLTGGERPRKVAAVVLYFTVALHAFGLVSRMLIEGRPPVTNLYSSAVFVGFGAVVLGAILEALYRNGIGAATAAIVGFMTLVVAHHLSQDGDTMEMMRAVLDSNFWLATHVVVITLGYAATFLAGTLAIVYVKLRFIFGQLDKDIRRMLAGMIYGIVCFATLFSFVGTILGGIWADQSWGRFWGWDPKENGALLIVIWNAVILHARWGGMIRDRGLAVMAIFGNIVTSWSWFGTNMLGIGLHSYGFTDAAFLWLSLFILSQVVFMFIGGFGREWNAVARAPSPSTSTGDVVGGQ